MNTAENENRDLTPDAANGYEAVILAGGMGSRLQEAVPDLPKVLAPVAEKPFLSYVINYLRMQGVTRFVFALGYKSEQVEKYLKVNYPTLSYSVIVENEPLGTGGAIRVALQKTKDQHVLIVNGDTLFKVNVEALFHQHLQTNAACTLALKLMEEASRYGKVFVDSAGRLSSFHEKGSSSAGLINGGVYVLNKYQFFAHAFPPAFSFEEQYLKPFLKSEAIYGIVQDGYFIDIGIPEDYLKAQTELASPALRLPDIDKSWTLFIDRDGVINEETVGEYILHWEQFIFSKGVLQSVKKLSDVFGRLLLVTNQRGVGKGLMTKEALDTIHYEMQREISVVGGHLDKIYFCTDVDNSSFNRKPNPGMAVQAQKDFPEIDFSKSIMVGNKPSDMRFGRAAGMYTVFLATTNPDHPYPHPDIDLRFSNLAEFAAAL
ncbi:MAG TPA: HAD-IIIA family hydrolase [Flavisolibacter sp.]|jgi:D-glycero-alpha-D-manno-heptose 1-phosphate guanylyltransferase|nr:HAD-IIIA family hydrolase [Flavisolibacter sp.]